MARLHAEGIHKNGIMRLTHLFCSLVILATMIVIPSLIFLNHGKLQGGPEIFGAFLIFWWAIDAATAIMLIGTWIRKRHLREKFFILVSWAFITCFKEILLIFIPSAFYYFYSILCGPAS